MFAVASRRLRVPSLSWLISLCALLLLGACTDPVDDDDTSADDDDVVGDDDTGVDDDDSGVDDDDDDDTAPPPIATSFAITGGGGDIASANHRARVVIGAPQPMGKSAGPNHAVTVGVDPSR